MNSNLDDAKEDIEVLNEKILISESLVQSTFVEQSQETVANTYNNRKISEYNLILVMCGVSNNDYRCQIIIPISLFTIAERKFYISANSGENGDTFNQNYVRYISDSSVALIRSSGLFNRN